MPFSRRDFFNKGSLCSLGLATVRFRGNMKSEKDGLNHDVLKAITQKVYSTPLVDTHEHFPNESERVKGIPLTNEKNNDWFVLFNQYIVSGLFSAGLPRKDYLKLISKMDPVSKWKYLEPWWPKIKTSGNCQALMFTLNELYGIEELTEVTIGELNNRYLDFKKTEAKNVAGTYEKRINRNDISKEAKKELEDHLFWYVIDNIKETKKPLKIHTGYHAQWEGKTFPMDLYSVRNNVADAFRLCQNAPNVTFVFFHIAYPYYEEMLALAKQYKNAYVDMAWSWIINPVAAVDFFKKTILTIPINKILPFGGGHYLPELAYGQSLYVRKLINIALHDLATDNYLPAEDAISLIDQIFYLNAKEIYNLSL